MDPTTSGVAVVVVDADAEFYVVQIRHCYNLESAYLSVQMGDRSLIATLDNHAPPASQYPEFCVFLFLPFQFTAKSIKGERGEPEKGKTAGGIFARAAMNAAHWQSGGSLFLKVKHFITYITFMCI